MGAACPLTRLLALRVDFLVPVLLVFELFVVELVFVETLVGDFLVLDLCVVVLLPLCAVAADEAIPLTAIAAVAKPISVALLNE
jgi:hypothetical protein